MLGRCLGFIALGLLSFHSLAVQNDEIITHLQSRMKTAPTGGKLIKSYEGHSQSYIYDQALAIIALTKHGDQSSAHSLLTALEKLQLKDGSLYFSYYMNGISPYPTEGDRRYAGAIAWVSIAANTYQHTFKSEEFVSFNYKVLKYLSGQMVTIGEHKAVLFNPTNLAHTSWNENETAALEHNLDAYSAFRHFGILNPKRAWNDETKHLKSYVLSLWDESRLHFWSGINVKTGVINKDEFYLDNQTWSMLALEKEILEKLNTKAALNTTCEELMVHKEGIYGFMDSKPSRRPAQSKFVWSEGTAGHILATEKYQKFNSEKIYCQDISAQVFFENMKLMKKNDGGIAYATASTNPDFSNDSSVAGTAWYYFAANSINPFDL